MKLLREAREKGNYKIANSIIDNKIRKSNKRRGNKTSPTTDDIERIIRDYIDDDFKRSIINKRTALLAVESLEDGDAIYGDASDFKNFISAVGKEKIADKMQELFEEENIFNLLQEEVELKTKTVTGFKWDDKIYLRETKVGLRAFEIKTGRFAKMPKNLFRKQ